MAYAVRIAYRQLYSLRHQVVGTLGMVFQAHRHFDFGHWVQDSAPLLASTLDGIECGDSLYLKHGDSSASMVQNYAMLLNVVLMAYERTAASRDPAMRVYKHESTKSTSMSDHADEDDYGTELGGGWDCEAFVIRSGILLSFGVLEEFERGTLRILYNYCGSPPGKKLEQIVTPRLADYKAVNDDWKRAESQRRTACVSGRHSLLRDFGIDADPATDWYARLRGMRTDRNTIAHGFAALTHPFQTYLALHYDIFRYINHLAQEVLAHRSIQL